MINHIKECWDKARDPLLAIGLVCMVGGAAWELGRFGIQVLKLPIVIALAMGLAFAVGNDGFHAVKRLVRDRVWPAIKSAWRKLINLSV